MSNTIIVVSCRRQQNAMADGSGSTSCAYYDQSTEDLIQLFNAQKNQGSMNWNFQH
jgi:hypothetical protein